MKESITSNPDISRESIEKALPDIKTLLLASYQEQWNSVYTLDQSFEKVKKLCQDIALLLKWKGITIEPTQSAIIAFFRKSNIVFPISPMAVWPWKYRVNHPLYLLWKSELYDMSRIRFDVSYELPIRKKWVSLSEVRESLVPDIRESRGFMLDGLTVGNPKNWESTILLFPDRIIQNAKKENCDTLYG